MRGSVQANVRLLRPPSCLDEGTASRLTPSESPRSFMKRFGLATLAVGLLAAGAFAIACSPTPPPPDVGSGAGNAGTAGSGRRKREGARQRRRGGAGERHRRERRRRRHERQRRERAPKTSGAARARGQALKWTAPPRREAADGSATAATDAGVAEPSGTPHRSHRMSAPEPPIGSVSVDVTSPGITVPSQFIGLSIEWSGVLAVLSDGMGGANPVTAQLLRNFASDGHQVHLRIGGNSTDRAWLAARGPDPAGRRHHQCHTRLLFGLPGHARRHGIAVHPRGQPRPR